MGQTNPALRPAEKPQFELDAVSERVARLRVPEPKEPTQIHSLVKLAPIPLSREVRLESQVIYLLAWAGTAALAWGGFQISADWLLWYGAAALLIFAVLFRLEGPKTRAERLAREAEVQRCHEVYVQAESRLKKVLTERFNERMQEFRTIRGLYDAARQAGTSIETHKAGDFLASLGTVVCVDRSPEAVLAAHVDQLERKMLDLVHELEGFSSIHKEEIDAAIMARHNARLAYWQAKLDAAVLTGEAMQQH